MKWLKIEKSHYSKLSSLITYVTISLTTFEQES